MKIYVVPSIIKLNLPNRLPELLKASAHTVDSWPSSVAMQLLVTHNVYLNVQEQTMEIQCDRKDNETRVTFFDPTFVSSLVASPLQLQRAKLLVYIQYVIVRYIFK